MFQSLFRKRPKPRVSVCITTRNSASRLENLLREVACFADETVIGVDESSTDDTWDVARHCADVTYRFRKPGHMAPVRMLPFEYATGDWILSLDDDEGLEDSFDAVLPELLAARDFTHWWFPRKTIVSYEPLQYAWGLFWFPDWQLRLFRNDASLVWKPPRYHSGYLVMGPGGKECRTSLLHFDHLVRSEAEREEKYARYLSGGSNGMNEKLHRGLREAFTRTTAARTRKQATPCRCKRIDERIRQPQVSSLPPWRATILEAKHADHAWPNEHFVVEARVRNTGKLDWRPSNGRWPNLTLGYRLLDTEGRPLQPDNVRSDLPYAVRPGGEASFMYVGSAPAEPGNYLLEWDMMSEGECWFAECGGTPLRTPLRVVAAAACGT